MYDIRSLNENIYLDASLNDIGLCDNDLVYTLCIPSAHISYNITLLPMVNVVVALEIWGQLWTNICVHIEMVVFHWSQPSPTLFQELVKVMSFGYCSVVK